MLNHDTSGGSEEQCVVLVVDDDPANLDILADTLSRAGLKALMATDGFSALKQARQTRPDIILLDIMMPGLDGLETCRRLKADEACRDIPVIFMSALSDPVDQVMGFRLGAVDYVTKPIRLETMLARLKTHLTLRTLEQNLRRQNTQLHEENRKRQALEVELRGQNEELDAFARSVAHDLKSPLAVMVGYADFLMTIFSEVEPAEALAMLAKIKQTGQKMSHIINDLLLLAGVLKTEPTIAPLDMAQVVGQARQRLELMIQEYQGELILPAQWPAALGYGPWVEAVWVNYLSNGLKYGGQPPRLTLGAAPEGGGQVRFWVKDNGPGLSPEEQQRLFNEFTRLHQSSATGHGLGLAITRRIVEKLGGQVGIESAGVSGQGSVFYFTLPVKGVGSPASQVIPEK
jgi:signal transduction histidine kinase